jgi:hypothetical protein
MKHRESGNYLDRLIDREGFSICSHHLELCNRLKKVSSKDELLVLLKEFPELLGEIKATEGLSLNDLKNLSFEELKEIVAHALVDIIYDERKERGEKLRERERLDSERQKQDFSDFDRSA